MPKRLPLAKQLERDVIHLLVAEQRFYKRVAHALNPELLSNVHARRIAEVALAYYRETPNCGSMGMSLVAQRLRRLQEQGKLTLEDTGETFDWLDEVFSQKLPDREGVTRELASELRRVMENDLIARSMELYGKNAPLAREIMALLQKAENLGKSDESRGSTWDDDTDDMSLREVAVDRLPTGIEELDLHMRGGMKRGELGFAIAPPGAGKSMLLSQIAASAMHAKHNVLIVTLEVSERLWQARLRAAASDLPADLILEDELTERDRAQIKRARGGQLARIVSMSAGKKTTVEDVWALFDELNNELEAKGSDKRFDVLIVDYADKLGYGREFRGSYEGYEHVYETLRLGADERKIWCWTASQAKRSEQNKKRKDGLIRMEDVADSYGKCRAADVVITLNVTSDKQHVRVLLEKNRTGEGNFLSEYLPTDYAFGRMVQPNSPRSREEAPDSALTLPFQ